MVFQSTEESISRHTLVVGLQEIRGTREVWLPNLDDQTRVQLSHLRTLDRVPCSGKVTTGSVD